MVKSKNAKIRAIEKKKGKRDDRLKDPNWGKHGCARLKALHQPEPDEEKSFVAKLRFWK